MTTKVVAFDIDGALTKEEGVEKFNEEKLMGNYVCIVAARPPSMMRDFIKSSSIKPCFAKSAPIFKGQRLRMIKRDTTADKYVYYGSWERDGIHALFAGWEYKEL